MRKYKLVLLLRSGLKKEKKEKLIKEVETWIGDVKEKKVQELGEKKLASLIKGQQLADYHLLEFEKADAIKDLDKRLLMQEDILRHLLVRVD